MHVYVCVCSDNRVKGVASFHMFSLFVVLEGGRGWLGYQIEATWCCRWSGIVAFFFFVHRVDNVYMLSLCCMQKLTWSQFILFAGWCEAWNWYSMDPFPL